MVYLTGGSGVWGSPRWPPPCRSASTREYRLAIPGRRSLHTPRQRPALRDPPLCDSKLPLCTLAPLHPSDTTQQRPSSFDSDLCTSTRLHPGLTSLPLPPSDITPTTMHQFGFFFLFFCSSYTLVVAGNFVFFLILHLMDPQGPPPPASGAAANDAPLGNHPTMGYEFRPHGSNIPQAPFFPGFPHPASPMPFLFQQSFMPSLSGRGFPPTTQGGPSAPVDLTGGSQKRDSPECVAEQSKPSKKRRVAQKKAGNHSIGRRQGQG